ncbi:MAG: hypothetical protein ACLT5P_06695 [Flavonifractor plautii]
MAAVKIVDDIDDVLLSSQEGIIIRLHANEIPVQSRTAPASGSCVWARTIR